MNTAAAVLALPAAWLLFPTWLAAAITVLIVPGAVWGYMFLRAKRGER